jgi:hypothetical protein
MGRVIDKEIAEDKRIPCSGYRYEDPKTKKQRFLLWKPGVVGTLSDEQEPKFCDMALSDIVDGLPTRLEERFQILRGLEKLEEECACITKADREDFNKLIDACALSPVRKDALKKSIAAIRTC